MVRGQQWNPLTGDLMHPGNGLCFLEGEPRR